MSFSWNRLRNCLLSQCHRSINYFPTQDLCVFFLLDILTNQSKTIAEEFLFLITKFKETN